MYTVQGIIAKTINNTETQLERLAQVAGNVANINTYAHKAVRFEQIMNENGYLQGVARVDHSQGKLYKTMNDLDFAIEGAGFVPVTTQTGEIAYTREGMMKIGKDGYLFNNRNELIGDGIKIPPNYKKIQITDDGKVNVFMNNNEEYINIGRIPLVYFDNPEGLKPINGNKFIATKDSGEPILKKDANNFRQGFLEFSNVDMYDCIDTVVRMNTSTLASYKMIKVVDEIYTRGVMLTE